MELFELWAQCCDALQYQQVGENCAINGDCYDNLRPMGAALWFSIPYRLGVSPANLVWMHFLLIGASVMLSVKVFRAMAAQAFIRPFMFNKLQLLVLFLASITVHFIFFLPVLFHTLADAPAGLLALCGFWLLCLGHTRQSNAWTYAAAGICLGMAAWLRIFYLYPLLLVMAFYALRQVVSTKKKGELDFIFMALLPLVIQYSSTYHIAGHFSYVSKQESASWKSIHLTDSAIGYDTVMPAKDIPEQAHRYYSDCSINFPGIIGAWQQGAYSDAVCIVLHKVNFYFGSYMPRTYITYPSEFLDDDSPRNLLSFGQQFNKSPIWQAYGLSILIDADSSPINPIDHTADRMEVVQEKPNGSGAIFQGYSPQESAVYTFSVWLWTSMPVPKTISLAVLENPDDTLISQEVFELSSLPSRYHVTAEMSQGNRYKLLIGAVEGSPTSMGTEQGDFFYAWGAQLDAATGPLDYVPEIDVGLQRMWSATILVLNVFASLIALGICLICIQRKIWGAVAAFLFLIAIFGQALFVVPEQRFLVVFHTVVWWLTMAAAIIILSRIRWSIAWRNLSNV